MADEITSENGRISNFNFEDIVTLIVDRIIWTTDGWTYIRTYKRMNGMPALLGRLRQEVNLKMENEQSSSVEIHIMFLVNASRQYSQS